MTDKLRDALALLVSRGDTSILLNLTRIELHTLISAIELADSCAELAARDNLGRGVQWWDEDATVTYRAAKTANGEI